MKRNSFRYLLLMVCKEFSYTQEYVLSLEIWQFTELVAFLDLEQDKIKNVAGKGKGKRR